MGVWQDICIACYSGPARETTLVPILEQSALEHVFSLGLAGSLREGLRRGDLVAPVAAVRGDGLTDYWADRRLPAVADVPTLLTLHQAARRLGVRVASGVSYSTSTMYMGAWGSPAWRSGPPGSEGGSR